MHMIARFVNFEVLRALVPHLEVNAMRALSPAPPTVFKVNFLLNLCQFNMPESTTAFNPRFPTKYHFKPISDPA
jgi:hypothetical protein